MLPFDWYFAQKYATEEKRDLTALSLLRLNLITSVARVMPTEIIRSTAAAVTAAATFWNNLRVDCQALLRGDLLDRAVLWAGDDNPWHDAWQQVKQTADGPEWRFWIDWYQDELDGKPPKSREMLHEIAALSKGAEKYPISEADWQQGPKHIAAMIAGIQAKFLSAKTPQAEKLVFDSKTATFSAVPIKVENPQLLAATLSQVSDALDDAMANPGNGLSEHSRENRVLTRTVTKYGNDPQRIEMDFTAVAIGLRRQFEVKDLPKSEENLALLDAVEEGARAVRASHAEVAENRAVLAHQALLELPDADKQTLQDMVPVLVAISNDALGADFRADVAELINDALLPLPSGAPRLPAMDPAVRVFGRVSRMKLAMDRVGEIVDIIDGSRAYKALKIVKTGVSVMAWVSAFIVIGLHIFGVM